MYGFPQQQEQKQQQQQHHPWTLQVFCSVKKSGQKPNYDLHNSELVSPCDQMAQVYMYSRVYVIMAGGMSSPLSSVMTLCQLI